MVSSLHRFTLRTKPGSIIYCPHPSNPEYRVAIRDAYLTCKDCKVQPKLYIPDTSKKDCFEQKDSKKSVNSIESSKRSYQEPSKYHEISNIKIELKSLLTSLQNYVTVLEILKKIQKNMVVYSSDKGKSTLWRQGIYEQKQSIKKAHHSLIYLFDFVQKERRKSKSRKHDLYNVENTFYSQYIQRKMKAALDGLKDFDDIVSRLITQYKKNEKITKSNIVASEDVPIKGTDESSYPPICVKAETERPNIQIQEKSKKEQQILAEKSQPEVEKVPDPLIHRKPKKKKPAKRLSIDIRKELNLSQFSMQLLDIKTRLLCFAETNELPEKFNLPPNLTRLKALEILDDIRKCQYSLTNGHDSIQNIQGYTHHFLKRHEFPLLDYYKNLLDNFESSSEEFPKNKLSIENKSIVNLVSKQEKLLSQSTEKSLDIEEIDDEFFKEKVIDNLEIEIGRKPRISKGFSHGESILKFSPYIVYQYPSDDIVPVKVDNSSVKRIYTTNLDKGIFTQVVLDTYLGWRCKIEVNKEMVEARILQNPLRLQKLNESEPISLIHICDFTHTLNSVDIAIPGDRNIISLTLEPTSGEKQSSLYKILEFRSKCFKLCEGNFGVLEVTENENTFKIFNSINSKSFIIKKETQENSDFNCLLEINEMKTSDIKTQEAGLGLKTTQNLLNLQTLLEKVALEELSILHRGKCEIISKDSKIKKPARIYLHKMFIIKQENRILDLASVISYKMLSDFEGVEITFKHSESCVIGSLDSDIHIRAFADFLEKIIMYHGYFDFTTSYEHSKILLKNELLRSKHKMKYLEVKYATVEDDWSYIDFGSESLKLQKTVEPLLKNKSPEEILNYLLENSTQAEKKNSLMSELTLNFKTKLLIKFETPQHQMYTHLLVQAHTEEKHQIEIATSMVPSGLEYVEFMDLLRKIKKDENMVMTLQRLIVEVRSEKQKFYFEARFGYTLLHILFYGILVDESREGIISLRNIISLKKLESTLCIIALKSKKKYYVKFSTALELDSFIRLRNLLNT